MNQAVIFTDLDGTLLDHDTYSYEPAKAMLARLKQANIPVIPATSKTFSEVIELRQDIGLHGPFIVENGAAVYIPQDTFRKPPPNTQAVGGYWVRTFTEKQPFWSSKLKQLDPSFIGLFEAFSEMSVARVVELTGLVEEAAKRAQQRAFGEPLYWKGNDIQKKAFIEALTQLGSAPLEGGRFIHFSGHCDKGVALQWLMSEYQKQLEPVGKTCYAIALGDSPNDIAMLEAADIAVCIASPARDTALQINKTTSVYRSKHYGPQGWVECLETILSEKL